MKSKDRISQYMTPSPHTIGRDLPIQVAKEMMRKHRIRHLPVQDGGHLVGVLSDRDLRIAESFRGPGELTVEEVMTSDPYAVDGEANLGEVVTQMAEHRYGCAIIRSKDGHVVGIFTDTDALRVLAKTLN
jgi:acetoin utilization protein AcuB